MKVITYKDFENKTNAEKTRLLLEIIKGEVKYDEGKTIKQTNS